MIVDSLAEIVVDNHASVKLAGSSDGINRNSPQLLPQKFPVAGSFRANDQRRPVGCHPLEIMDDILPKDRYCAANVDIESCVAIYLELEAFGDTRRQFMFWRGDAPFSEFRCSQSRLRDLRPGDTVEFDGRQRRITLVQIYR